MISKISSNNGLNFSYFYDQNGQRIAKKHNSNNITTNFYYDQNGLLIYQDNPSNNLQFLYDSKNRCFGFIRTNKQTGQISKYYYLKDALNNVIEILDSNMNVVVRYFYDAFGNTIFTEGNQDLINLNPFRYRGYYYDIETQLYWASSRYYSPEICRWISPDLIEYLDRESINGLNLYCYCFNNPVNYVDPDGHMPFLCILLILGGIGMVANVGSQALMDLAYGNEFKWENYLIAAGAGFLGGMFYAIPLAGSIISAAFTSGLTTAGQMAVSGKDYDVCDYLIMAGGSALFSLLTACVFGILSDNMAFFKDSNFILKNFTKFATNCGGITLKSTVILQVAGQIAIRETISGLVGAPLSAIPGYFDRVYRLSKLGLSIEDSFRYAS
jgi:RHS repeat-associated protein